MPKKGYTQTKEHKDNIAKANIGLKQTQKAKDNMSKVKTGTNHYNWKGKEYQLKNGRWLICIKEGEPRILLSRHVAILYLKRELTSEEVVHHINEDPSDDRPENLYLFATRGKHARHHRIKNPPTLISNLI